MRAPPPGLFGQDARHHAEKLVSAEAHQQIVRAHVASQSLHDVPQQRVAGPVAVLVIDGLQTIDVHVRRRESLARSTRPVDLALEMQSHPASARAGQLLSPSELAVAS
jgi:hypothetical protein